MDLVTAIILDDNGVLGTALGSLGQGTVIYRRRGVDHCFAALVELQDSGRDLFPTRFHPDTF
jgi:hypothetical protein